MSGIARRQLDTSPVQACPDCSVIMLEVQVAQTLSQDLSFCHMQTFNADFIGNVGEINSALLANDCLELRKFRSGTDQSKRVANMNHRIIFRDCYFSVAQQPRKDDAGFPPERKITNSNALAIRVGHFQVNGIESLRIGFWSRIEFLSFWLCVGPEALLD